MSETTDDPTSSEEPMVTVSTDNASETGTDQVDRRPRTRRQPPYNVIIYNDEVHSFPYVIELLVKLFGHSAQKALDLTQEIHTKGRSIVFTTHLELAEHKQSQVVAYGPDPRMASSKCSLRCEIEAAE